MSKGIIGAAAVVALLVVGVLVYFVADDDGDDRKASIGAQGPKPDHPKAGPKSNDEAPDKSQAGKQEPPGKAKALAAMQRSALPQRPEAKPRTSSETPSDSRTEVVWLSTIDPISTLPRSALPPTFASTLPGGNARRTARSTACRTRVAVR